MDLNYKEFVLVVVVVWWWFRAIVVGWKCTSTRISALGSGRLGKGVYTALLLARVSSVVGLLFRCSCSYSCPTTS